MRIYYAQNREDLLIGAFFPDIERGFYIDIGANDPVIDSVTKLFYDKGWHGINIDPIRQHISDLKKDRPGDINLQIGIGDKKDRLLFTEYTEGDGLSTFADQLKKQYKNESNKPTTKHKDYMVTIKTLNDVITEYDVKHIHFLKIDVEGYEYEVINGYDWKSPRPELVCVEASHIFKDWRPIIESKNYKLVFFDGVNNYYLAKESLEREKYFDYPSATLAGPPVYYPAYLDVKESTEKRVSRQIKEIEDQLRQKLAEKEREASFLYNQQRDVRFLAKRLNTEIQIRLNRRANSYKPRRSISYQSDDIIKKAANNKKMTVGDALKLAHKRDKQNLKVKNKVVSGYFKIWFWRLASKCYGLITKLAKKVVPLR